MASIAASEAADGSDAGEQSASASDFSHVDLILHQKRPEAEVMLILPAGVETPRGIIVHGPHGKRQHSPRWVELSRELGFAHLVVTIDLNRNRRPKRLHDNIYASLDDLAELLDLPNWHGFPSPPSGTPLGG